MVAIIKNRTLLITNLNYELRKYNNALERQFIKNVYKYHPKWIKSVLIVIIQSKINWHDCFGNWLCNCGKWLVLALLDCVTYLNI